ncbi:MAG: hypothetical protein NT120_01250 [Candidatus Aenigmarchaeota archaeon]|nr:hypothetical protein [Candidatus Aenigmarchaeota archaeon]
MALDFLSLNPYTVLILIVFILFVLSLKKVIEIVKNAIIIAAAAVLFPIFANRFLGLPIPMDGETIVSFVVAGIGCYFIYLVVKSAYVLMKKGGSVAKKVMPDIKFQGKKEEKKEQNYNYESKKQHVDLIKKQLQNAKKNTEKEIFKDYAVIEDKEIEKKEPRKIKHGVVEEREEEEKQHIEPIKEIKFPKKKKK